MENTFQWMLQQTFSYKKYVLVFVFYLLWETTWEIILRRGQAELIMIQIC